MRTIKLQSGLQVPVVAVGCMRICSLTPGEAERFMQCALENGANFFDHADVYGGGECEALFARAVHMGGAVRERLILQSKCGIVPGKMYDFSKEHILASVDGVLKRLQTEYLDILLLHRPDALMEPEEVAAAFSALHQSGKVRHFGVSNQRPSQMRLLQKYVAQPIEINQVQLGLGQAAAIAQGLHVNVPAGDEALDRDGGVLDYCRLCGITVQAWSPFQYGLSQGVFIGDPRFPQLNAALQELAAQYGATPTTIALAWLLRHPAGLQPVTGTTKRARLLECLKAAEIRLTREEWYRLYLAAGYTLP